MKKILFCLSLFLFTIHYSLLTVHHIYAFDFNRAYQDYLYTYNQYRESHNQYITAKNQYLTYKTLTAKNKALNTTREMLKKRSEVLRTYLTALRMKLKETPGVDLHQADTLYLKIDNEVNWLIEHRDSLSSASTIEDLLELSGKFEGKYPEIEVIIYQTLGEILKGKEANLYSKASKLIRETEEKILEVKARDSEKALLLERWLLEAKKKMVRSLEKQNYSERLLKNLEPDEAISGNFHEAQFPLKESNQYLKEVVFYLKEIIQKIKYD